MVAEDGTLSVAVTGAAPTPEQQRLLHYTIKKVTDDIEALRFNTAISQMMVFTNEMTSWISGLADYWNRSSPAAAVCPISQ